MDASNPITPPLPELTGRQIANTLVARLLVGPMFCEWDNVCGARAVASVPDETMGVRYLCREHAGMAPIVPQPNAPTVMLAPDGSTAYIQGES